MTRGNQITGGRAKANFWPELRVWQLPRRSAAVAQLSGVADAPEGQLLYKIMTIENLLRSIAGSYLHFNRVDAYNDLDPNDGTYCRAINLAMRRLRSPRPRPSRLPITTINLAPGPMPVASRWRTRTTSGGPTRPAAHGEKFVSSLTMPSCGRA